MPLPENRRKWPWYLRYDLGGRIASEGRKLMIKATHQHCTVQFNGPVRLGAGFHLDIPDWGTLIIGHGVDFRRGFTCQIVGGGRVTIGDATTFTSNTLIQCGSSIDIGKACAFGQSVLIVDGYHRYTGTDDHWWAQGYDFRPLEIGDGAGVSDKCTVQADIGERAMIASGSVVNRPIPAYCLAVGRPAKVVRYFGPPDQKPQKPARRPRRRNADRYLPTETDGQG